MSSEKKAIHFFCPKKESLYLLSFAKHNFVCVCAFFFRNNIEYSNGERKIDKIKYTTTAEIQLILIKMQQKDEIEKNIVYLTTSKQFTRHSRSTFIHILTSAAIGDDSLCSLVSYTNSSL